MAVLNDAIFYYGYEISTFVTQLVEHTQQFPFFDKHAELDVAIRSGK